MKPKLTAPIPTPLHRIARALGRRILYNRIFNQLYSEHYYAEGFLPMSDEEIRQRAQAIEERYYRFYLAA